MGASFPTHTTGDPTSGGSWVLAALCHAADHAHESASNALDALSQASAEAPMDLEPWLHAWADPGEVAGPCQAADSSDVAPPALVQGSPDARRQRQFLVDHWEGMSAELPAFDQAALSQGARTAELLGLNR